MYLYKLAGGSIALPTPVSRLELLMAAACGEAVVPYDPVSRLEWFWSQIVNEPLAKIGDYADELSSEDATVTIQTVSGSNTLTIGTDLQPSSVSITGNISQ